MVDGKQEDQKELKDIHVKFNITQNDIFDPQHNESINYPIEEFVSNPNFRCSSAEFRITNNRK